MGVLHSQRKEDVFLQIFIASCVVLASFGVAALVPILFDERFCSNPLAPPAPGGITVRWFGPWLGQPSLFAVAGTGVTLPLPPKKYTPPAPATPALELRV